jgi:hypothetical protein
LLGNNGGSLGKRNLLNLDSMCSIPPFTDVVGSGEYTVYPYIYFCERGHTHVPSKKVAVYQLNFLLCSWGITCLVANLKAIYLPEDFHFCGQFV